MGFFSKSEPDGAKSPIFDMTDEEPVLILDAQGSNVFVYDKFIVIDRTKGGLFNLGNRTYQIRRKTPSFSYGEYVNRSGK